MTLLSRCQTGKRSANLPPLLRNFFSSLSILQLDTGGILDPACYATNPFNKELGQFGASLITIVVTLVLLLLLRCLSRRRMSRVTGLVAMVCRVALSGLTILYPTVATSALLMVHCETQHGVLVLYANPVYQCYTSDHLTAAVLAWLVLAVLVVGFPVLSWLHLRRGVKELAEASKVRDR